jgi:3-phenylpropionate/trans-cinnamate dioxygenase ferredoxin reductase subunit
MMSIPRMMSVPRADRDVATMVNLHVKYLLVGGGVASGAAAQSIRAADANGAILLIAQERTRPYHRPPLSKALLRREVGRDAIFVTPPAWFEQNGVELRTGRRVTRLDPSRHSATLDSGEELSYDRLLLATGATPLPLDVPGAALPNLYSLRTLEDLDRLSNAIDQARAEGLRHASGRGKVVVIGGGLLGMELAGSLTQMEMGVDLVAEGHPWHRWAGEATGRFAVLSLRRAGVTVHANQRPLRLEGDGRVQRVVLTDGSQLPCDLAIAAIGAAANKDVLRGSSIEAERAILTDPACRTSAEDVFAAGDCAAILDPLFGKYRWIDHWSHAQTTGALAGRNMAGANDAYAGVNRFESEVLGMRLVGWGESRFVDRRLIRGTPDVAGPAGFAEIGVAADGRVSQVLWVGPREARVEEELSRLVAERVNVTGREEQLKDPAAPLRA